MTSILISSDTASVGERVSKAVADALGFACLGRELLAEVAEAHGVKERDLVSAMGFLAPDARSLGKAGRMGLVFIAGAVLERLKGDNLVVDGLGAHLYVREIPHILSVRILSDVQSHTHRLAARRGISPKKARKLLERWERQAKHRSMDVFGVDETSPGSYDMVISLGNIDEERAVKTIAETAGDRKFQTMTYSRKCLADQALAGRIRVALLQRHPKVRVAARDGTAVLVLPGRWGGWRKAAEALKTEVGKIPGVEFVEVHRAGSPSAAPPAGDENTAGQSG